MMSKVAITLGALGLDGRVYRWRGLFDLVLVRSVALFECDAVTLYIARGAAVRVERNRLGFITLVIEPQAGN